MARSKFKIEAAKVEALASYGCTMTEIASFFGCEKNTMGKCFSANITKGRQSGKTTRLRLRKRTK